MKKLTPSKSEFCSQHSAIECQISALKDVAKVAHDDMNHIKMLLAILIASSLGITGLGLV